VAAQRAGCVKILIPEENEKDYRELPKDVQKGLQWHLVRRMEEVLDLALVAEVQPSAQATEDAPHPGDAPGASAAH
jgi:ATP-dependent Lon protease